MDISVEQNRNGSLTLRTLVRDPKNPDLGPYFHKHTFFDYSEEEARELFAEQIKDEGLQPVD